MEDTEVLWEDVQDPMAKMQGEYGFRAVNRDPERSPFQWNDSVSAGEWNIPDNNFIIKFYID